MLNWRIRIPSELPKTENWARDSIGGIHEICSDVRMRGCRSRSRFWGWIRIPVRIWIRVRLEPGSVREPGLDPVREPGLDPVREPGLEQDPEWAPEKALWAPDPPIHPVLPALSAPVRAAVAAVAAVAAGPERL